MKITMIGQKYVPSREGGVDVVVENLSVRMAAQGNEVTLYNRRRKDKPTLTEYKGCKTETVYTVQRRQLDAPLYALGATLRAKKAGKRGEVDVLHFHSEGPCLFLGLLPKREKRNYKIVVTVHGLDWQRDKWKGLGRKVLQFAEEQIVKYADEIIVLSENCQNYFFRRYGVKTTFIPNGVNRAVLRKAELIKEKWGLEKDSFVLFLARIVPEKGLHYLLDAWEIVRKKTGTQKKLVVAGGDSHASKYYAEMMKKVKDDPSVIVTGYVEGQALEELYSNAFLYILPSDLEGMPMSLLEALSYGNRCLVSDIPENTAIVCEDKYIFPRGNVAKLAERIEELLCSAEEEEAGSVSLHSWEEIVERTMEVYER